MQRIDIPGLGEVLVGIDEIEFFQAGQVRRDLETVTWLNGQPVSLEQYELVRVHLKTQGMIS